MTSMQHWIPEQWAVFTATIAAGLIAAAVLAILRRGRWTPPPLLRAHGPGPRPSLVLASRRTIISNGLTDADHRFNERSAGQLKLPTRAARRTMLDRDMRLVLTDAYNAAGGVVHALPTWTDPTKADYTEPGIGALSSILALDDDAELMTEAERAVATVEWINAYADLSTLMPETDAAAEAMRVALEPAMRTAKLWRIRCEGSSARQALNDWRMDTPTGELPPLDLQYMTARALLVS